MCKDPGHTEDGPTLPGTEDLHLSCPFCRTLEAHRRWYRTPLQPAPQLMTSTWQPGLVTHSCAVHLLLSAQEGSPPGSPEAGREVHGHVLVALLEAVVLSDVVKVVSADDDGPLHLHFGHHARQDPPSNGDVTSKRAFLVNVGALDGLLWSLKAQTNVLVVSRELFFASFSKQDPLLILKDGRLLLVRTFCLNVCHLPGCLKKKLKNILVSSFST